MENNLKNTQEIVSAEAYLGANDEHEEIFLEEVKIQARSYAKQLGAKYSVIASKEKVWVMSSKDDYSKEIFSATWHELNDSDSFYELFRLLGKGK